MLWAALTLAYIWRFWSGIFLGARRVGAHQIPLLLVAPVALLGALSLIGGVFVEPFAGLAEAAGAVSYNAPTPIEPTYHLDARPENLLALGAYALGATIIVSRPLWVGGALAVSRLGKVAGPERMYRLNLMALNRFSDWFHQVEVRDLRTRVAAILWPSGVLVGAGILATPTMAVYRVGQVDYADFPLLLALFALTVAAVTTTLAKRHISLALVLSSAGFVLAVVYAFFGAPDVALVAVLIETIITLILIATLKLIPFEVLRRQSDLLLERRWRKILTAVVAGGFTFAVVWGGLSQPTAERSVAEEHVQLTPDAHAKDVVTAILADFRGLDTMGEITVVALVLLGIASLLRAGRLK